MIIEKYKDERKTDKVFNMISLSNICINLKEIAKLCGIERNLTYHCLRHSDFSFLLRYNVLQYISA